jgi:hypothetical protein
VKILYLVFLSFSLIKSYIYFKIELITVLKIAPAIILKRINFLIYVLYLVPDTKSVFTSMVRTTFSDRMVFHGTMKLKNSNVARKTKHRKKSIKKLFVPGT